MKYGINKIVYWAEPKFDIDNDGTDVFGYSCIRAKVIAVNKKEMEYVITFLDIHGTQFRCVDDTRLYVTMCDAEESCVSALLCNEEN